MDINHLSEQLNEQKKNTFKESQESIIHEIQYPTEMSHQRCASKAVLMQKLSEEREQL